MSRTVRFEAMTAEITYYPSSGVPTIRYFTTDPSSSDPSTARSSATGLPRRSSSAHLRRPLLAPWAPSSSDDTDSSSGSPPPTPRREAGSLPTKASPRFNVHLTVFDNIANQMRSFCHEPATVPPCQMMTFVDIHGIIKREFPIKAKADGYVSIRDVLKCLEVFVSDVSPKDIHSLDEGLEGLLENMDRNLGAREGDNYSIVDVDNKHYFVGIMPLVETGYWRFIFSD